jgi:hypothetical protein
MMDGSLVTAETTVKAHGMVVDGKERKGMGIGEQQ